MNRYYPTLKDIVYNTIAVIHRHPAIQDPIVNYPLPDTNGIYQPVPIERYRTYDGMELQEPGLTLSVFPRYSPGDGKYGGTVASEYKPITMGDKTQGFMYETTYYLVVHLAYQDVAINNNKAIVYVEDADCNVTSAADLYTDGKKPIRKFSVETEINPGEEILRDYLEVLRVLLESIDSFVPWSIRSSQITNMTLPSTSWSKANEQIYFHRAFMNWELVTYAPATYEEIPKVRNLIIKGLTCI